MNPEQIETFKAWLLDLLNARESNIGPAPAGDPIFDASKIYRQITPDGPAPPLPRCSFMAPQGESIGRVEITETTHAHKIELELAENPVAPFDVGVALFSKTLATPRTGGVVTVAPGVDTAATVAAILAALQGLEGPAHVATYAAGGDANTIALESVPELEGYPIEVTSTIPSGFTATTTQEPLREVSRDLKLTTVLVRIETAPPEYSEDQATRLAREAATAPQLGEKIVALAKSPGGIDRLIAARMGLQGTSGPSNSSRAMSGSQGTEVSIVTFRIFSDRVIETEVLTIESLAGSAGTIETGGETITATIGIQE